MGIIQNIVIYLAVSFVFAAAVCANKYEDEWENFKAKFKRTYESPELESSKKKIFLQKLDDIEKHNEKYRNGLVKYTIGINQFSDMSIEEFQEKMCGVVSQPKDPNVPVFYKSNNLTGPLEFDWRAKGVVTPIKDQGNCSAGYAFSVVCPWETLNALTYGDLMPLSEQNLVDCSKKQGNKGCTSGTMKNCYDYINQRGIWGLCFEKYYPFEQKEGKCRFKRMHRMWVAANYVNVNASEDALRDAVTEFGPVSAGIATGGSFRSYSGGIFHDTNCGSNITHAVAIVGYGTEKGQQYWIIKNSFGTSWGEKGYMRLARGQNLCGISNEASYPQW